MIDDDTINRWIGAPGQIHLRQSPRKSTVQRDIGAAKGILLSVLIGGDVILWTYIIARAFW